MASQQVDHIKPIHQGGDDSHTNLQGICEKCHKEKSADEMTHLRSVQHPARRIDNIIP
jgi:5-methylcytosine-specific restriction protein A|tara:strand:- start:902 stop:1075 length:174 start_codon:yes stop_codon:yes gene_type:complete